VLRCRPACEASPHASLRSLLLPPCSCSQLPWNASGVLMLFRNEDRLRRIWRLSNARRRVLQQEEYLVTARPQAPKHG
jgi:hypothetical protein